MKFLESSGIVLSTYEDSPTNALERDLIKFTYKEPKFAYIIPVIILSIFTLVVGIIGKNTDPSIGKWLIYAAASGLVGNALPGYIMTFTGNLGEAGMQYSLLQAARIVYGGQN